MRAPWNCVAEFIFSFGGERVRSCHNVVSALHKKTLLTVLRPFVTSSELVEDKPRKNTAAAASAAWTMDV